MYHELAASQEDEIFAVPEFRFPLAETDQYAKGPIGEGLLDA